MQRIAVSGQSPKSESGITNAAMLVEIHTLLQVVFRMLRRSLYSSSSSLPVKMRSLPPPRLQPSPTGCLNHRLTPIRRRPVLYFPPVSTQHRSARNSSIRSGTHA
eukprot:2138139-Rhodomonas_salina.3